MKRKIVQFQVTDDALYALDEDGALWRVPMPMPNEATQWFRITALPDKEGGRVKDVYSVP